MDTRQFAKYLQLSLLGEPLEADEFWTEDDQPIDITSVRIDGEQVMVELDNGEFFFLQLTKQI